MLQANLVLPSNRKFGFFFTGVFCIVSIYFYFKGTILFTYSFGLLSLITLIITIFKSNILLPFNKLWMKFGLFLGMIISPILLGLIFFIFITPIALIIRLLRRDELNLTFEKRNSYWIKRQSSNDSKNFKHQF